MTSRESPEPALVKFPAITAGFWLIKILATTLGETAGDTVSMTLDLGYLVGTSIFLVLLVVLAWCQVRARSYRPALYWATIIASTTAGTTLADFATRSLGIGYPGGSLLLAICVAASLALWYLRLGSVSVETVRSMEAEVFYWITISFSQTLGTALGDWTADTGGLGYLGGMALFGGVLALLLMMYLRTDVNRVWLFWAAFILTRPLGATVGDFLTKPMTHGGLSFSRPVASLVLVIVIVVLIAMNRKGSRPSPPHRPAG